MMLFLITIFFSLNAQIVQAQFEAINSYSDPVDQQSLNGWHGPMLKFKKHLDPNKNYVIALLHRPVNAFLMQNIFHFRSSLAASKKDLKKNTVGKLGHFQVAWSCRLPGEKKLRVGMTGQTGENSGQGSRMLLEGGYGMSLFFSTFTDGYLQSSLSQAERIYKSSKSYGFDWIAFEISPEDCEYGLSYLSTYIERRSYTNFSFTKDPAEFEGGGCTSFGSELFFQFGGISAKLINQWRTTLLIPKGYLANPKKSELPENTVLEDWLQEKPYTERKAGLFYMAHLPNFALKKNKIPANIYDTEKILYSIREMTRRAQQRFYQSFPSGYQIPERRAYGLLRADNNHIKSSVGSKFIIVDEKYHSDFKKLNSYIDSKDVPRAHIADINGVPGAIFEKVAW